MTDLLTALAAYESPNVFNPWRHVDDMGLAGERAPASLRRNRLRAHFDCQPEFLLIGEAPGYQGCRYSGVPFTSEALIVEGKIPRITSGRFTTREKPFREPSATIVWGALHDLGIAERTVLWNAFAWHPHRPGEPLSNRTPRDGEFRDAMVVLRMVLDRFDGVLVVTVGEKACNLLTSIGVKNTKVRHPANGGARLFRQRLAEIVKTTEVRR